MTEVRSIPLHVRVSPAIHDALRERADRERRPLAALLAIILEDAAKIDTRQNRLEPRAQWQARRGSPDKAGRDI